MSVFYDLSKTPRNILNQAIVRAIISENNGALFDPSDLSTLYQDVAGTIPVTAVEQPVGLMLDKSRGMMLGPDKPVYMGLLWTLNAGTYTKTTAGWSPLGFYGLELKKTYFLTFRVKTLGAGQLIYLVRRNSAGTGNETVTTFNVVAGGIYTARVSIVTDGYTPAELWLDSDTFIGDIDNISIKELYGYHATQSITASRPTLSARYNMLTKTEDFSDAVWSVYAQGTGSVPIKTNNYGIAPDGSQTAGRIQLSLNGGNTNSDRSDIYTGVSTVAGMAYSIDVWFKTADNTTKTIALNFNFLGGENVIITGVWKKFTVSLSSAIDTYRFMRFGLRGGSNTSDSADILIWHPQQVVGLSAGPYQRVNTATDYDTDERYFPKYLRFDGVDDYLNLPYMGLYAGGEMSIIAARNAVSQATDTYIISERSTTDADPKYFPSRQLASAGNMDAYISDDAGTVVLDTVGSPFSGVANAVIRSIVDSGNNLKLLKNGVLAANDNYTRSGTLTLNNTTIGASVSTTTSNYASMKMYGLIVTKSALTDAQRVRCERFLARKSGVML